MRRSGNNTASNAIYKVKTGVRAVPSFSMKRFVLIWLLSAESVFNAFSLACCKIA